MNNKITLSLISLSILASVNLVSARAETTEKAKENGWKGSVEAGASYASGNTEEENLHGEVKLEKMLGKWENHTKLRADSSKKNDDRTSEKYKVENQTRRNFTENDYGFLELEYVNDRFSGYNYRISELLGYGRHLVKNDDLKLSAEASIGARQSELESGIKEEGFLGKLGGNLDWKINDNVSFTEDLSVAIGSDTTITESETAIKSSLTDTLYLKLSFDVQHIADVPIGRENTDTLTSLKLGYDF